MWKKQCESENNFVLCGRNNVLFLRLSSKRPISSKKDASSSSSSSMLCPAKGINEVEGTLTSISSAAEVVVFSSVSSTSYSSSWLCLGFTLPLLTVHMS